jgi:hypothetical protein
MRIALLADLHANLPAVRAVLNDAAQIGCDAIWCAGDIVGRGPHPNEVVEALRALEVPTVQGNWDEAVGMGREVTGSIWESPEAKLPGSTRWHGRRPSSPRRTSPGCGSCRPRCASRPRDGWRTSSTARR